MAERSNLTNQINLENDFRVGMRLKSMEKQKLINEENKMNYNLM